MKIQSGIVATAALCITLGTMASAQAHMVDIGDNHRSQDNRHVIHAGYGNDYYDFGRSNHGYQGHGYQTGWSDWGFDRRDVRHDRGNKHQDHQSAPRPGHEPAKPSVDPEMVTAPLVTIGADNPFENVGFVGKDGLALVQPFEIELAGTYKATLSDFSFPEAFDVIQMVVTSATGELGRAEEPGSFIFSAEPGKYFLSLWAQLACDAIGLGLYGIEIAQVGELTPVGLPSAGFLLLSALGWLAWRSRRRGEGDFAFAA